MTCAVPQPHNCICWALALSMSLLRPSDPIHITLHCVADCPVLDHVAKLDPNRKTNTLLQPGPHPSDKPVTDPHQTYMFLNTETHHCVLDPNSASIMEQLTQDPNTCLTCVWLAFHTAPIPKTNPGRTQVMGRCPSTPCLPRDSCFCYFTCDFALSASCGTADIWRPKAGPQHPELPPLTPEPKTHHCVLCLQLSKHRNSPVSLRPCWSRVQVVLKDPDRDVRRGHLAQAPPPVVFRTVHAATQWQPPPPIQLLPQLQLQSVHSLDRPLPGS